MIYAIAQNKVVLEIANHFISFLVYDCFDHKTLLTIDCRLINHLHLHDQSTVPDLILSYGIDYQPDILLVMASPLYTW